MADLPHAIAHYTSDFALTGDASSPEWLNAPWLSVAPVRGPSTYRTAAKILYSATGIYCLFDCQDRVLTTTGLKDQADLWTEDVVEAFFQPDARIPIYLEYELSPLNAELLLLVPNHDGQFHGWRPWRTEPARRPRHATSIQNGSGNPIQGGAITHWSAEFFLPFTLFTGLTHIPPGPHSSWRANFCRIDHDNQTQTLFSWSPGISDTFHNPSQFGQLTFKSL